MAVSRPSPRTFDLYMNFIAQAIFGLPGPADRMMQQHGNSIRRVARYLRHFSPVDAGPYYRGVLLEPSQVPASRQISGAYQNATFRSFTDNLDVACWFANTQTSFARNVMQMRPRCEGWISEYTASPSEILFHYRWTDVLDNLAATMRFLTLEKVADDLMRQLDPRRMIFDPKSVWHQLNYNIHTQHEVTLTGNIIYPIRPVTDYTCSSLIDLERQLRYRPPYLAVDNQKLFALGLPPGAQIPITSINFATPPIPCRLCGRPGVTCITQAGPVTWYECDLCNEDYFTL